MQLIANGPDIPDLLLQAHEDGRVVFFCGAGISYPAGLPGFKGLVDLIYRNVGTSLNDIEREAYERNQFDATLDLLERRLPGQRRAVREALADALKLNWRKKVKTDTHEALLELGRQRGGSFRLVTTNFDRIFAKLCVKKQLSIQEYPAPLLPIPKTSRWDGLVYLHGLLPEDSKNVSELNRLVVTSGDFGLAYLTERWAARFVSELFRNYLVCFVGYSINDPVLRYMMDALAADRMLGEVTPQAYALGDYSTGEMTKKYIEWEAKGVTPILYEVPSGTHDHSALHQTLKVWAETYRDGIFGKERIVIDYAMTRPSASTVQDDFVRRMLWALSDKSGLPAKRFAELNPVPSLDWLEPFAALHYKHRDLSRFNVSSQPVVEDKLSYSLVLRPAPYTHTPWMSLVSAGEIAGVWDDVMHHIARWLLRHLDNPDLLLWLVDRGGKIHAHFARMIEQQLKTIKKLELNEALDELSRIRDNSPAGIPRTLLRTIWRLLLTGRIRSTSPNLSLYSWKERLATEGLTTLLRFELRELLAPKIELARHFSLHTIQTDTDSSLSLGQLFDWDLVLACKNVRSFARSIANEEHWIRVLPELHDDFQRLLLDALDLIKELGEANEYNDRSSWYIPSISPHPQNSTIHEWPALIELLRDSWLAIRATDAIRATKLAINWFEIPYPTFKRLALYTASFNECISVDRWVDWLIQDGARWLWSHETKIETLRLLAEQGNLLRDSAQERLESAILEGPTRALYSDIRDEERPEIVDRAVWTRLTKLSQSTLQLGALSQSRLTAISETHPTWQFSGNQRDEFTGWTSNTASPVAENDSELHRAPKKRVEIVEWLKETANTLHPLHEDTWRKACRRHLMNCGFALWDLSQEDIWLTNRWQEALHTWSDKQRAKYSWRFLAPLIKAMPDEVLKTAIHSVSFWLKAVSESLDRHKDTFLTICQRILELSNEDTLTTEAHIINAINHPVGRVVESLLNVWFNQHPNDNDRLPNDLNPIFTHVCDTNVARFRYGRLLLAANAIAFFRVDRTWADNHLLPLFDWNKNSDEARIAWVGYLWSPRLYRPLLVAFKSYFLTTAQHYEQLGESRLQYVTLLTNAALEPIKEYSVNDFQLAFAILPQMGLEESARALIQALESAGDQREHYWTNRIQPFWQNVWPKSRSLASEGLAASLAELTLASYGKFPQMLGYVIDWLMPIEDPHFVVSLLVESELHRRFPTDALKFLDALIGQQTWLPRELRSCIETIKSVDPDLQTDLRYQRIDHKLRQNNL